MKRRIDEVEETIEDNKVGIVETRQRLETLEKDKQNQVYFSAYDNEGGEVTGKLKFPKVVTNLGGAFDGSSGTFTAPVKGVYTFSFSGQQPKTAAKSSLVDFMIELNVIKNGVTVFIITDDRNSDQSETYQNINSIFSLELDENDTVYLELPNYDDELYASGVYRLIFMGQLVVAT